MTDHETDADALVLFDPSVWYRPDGGPRYLQLADHIASHIAMGNLLADQKLPAERDIAETSEVSRVTVRRALTELVERGFIEQRRGAGSFVRMAAAPVEHSLTAIASLTETLAAQGKIATSDVLEAVLNVPTSDDMLRFGLVATNRVATLRRLRRASGTPIALEASKLPADILPDPSVVGPSLYEVLRGRGNAPTRAIQKISAVRAGVDDAVLLEVEAGSPLLQVDRTSFIETGRPIEFTRGLYRSDVYDFVTEVHGI